MLNARLKAAFTDFSSSFSHTNDKKQAAFSVKTNIKKAFLASKYSFCEDEKLPFSDHLEGLNGTKCRCNT